MPMLAQLLVHLDGEGNIEFFSGVLHDISERISVIYAGKIVEYTDTRTLYEKPRHPYTFGLFGSLPEMHKRGEKRLREIPGSVPNPLRFPSGCKFHPRCFKRTEQCTEHEPELARDSAGHELACHHPIVPADARVEA